MAETLLVVGLGASLLGTGISTIAGIQQAKFQAQIAKRSAEISRLNAERAVERSQIEAQDQDRLAAAVIGDAYPSRLVAVLAYGVVVLLMGGRRCVNLPDWIP